VSASKVTDEEPAEELVSCHTLAPRHTLTCLGIELRQNRVRIG
jgi:hypothetical protein